MESLLINVQFFAIWQAKVVAGGRVVIIVTWPHSFVSVGMGVESRHLLPLFCVSVDMHVFYFVWIKVAWECVRLADQLPIKPRNFGTTRLVSRMT